LKAIFDAIDSTVMETLKQAIEAKDALKFVATYKELAESCYACHKANGFNYLRPQIPTQPPQTVINYDPNATWPQ
jgi:mono/diheme cytochrome c family protein